MTAPRWYVGALRLLPRAFAEELGADMAATFGERAMAARMRGRAHYARFCARELAGLLRTAVTEHVRARDGTPHGRDISRGDVAMRELKHAARRLVRAPGFTMAAVLTLALAIGANAAIFTLVQRVVLAPLPYADPDRLIALDHSAPGLDLPSGVGMSTGTYREYSALPTHESTAIYVRYGVTMSGDGTAERLDAIVATPSLTRVLRVAPQLGRWFTEAESEPGAAGTIVLTDAFWRTRFGADPGVIGRTVRLDERPYEVVGVMPRGFAFPDETPQILMPLQLDLAQARPGGFNFRGVARLAPGATLARARAEHDAVIADMEARFPEHAQFARAIAGEVRLSSSAVGLKGFVVGDSSRMLWVLLASVGIVLLIACANIANLFLVRTEARRREVAVRRALGAGTRSIAGYFMAETALVCGVAAAIGLVIARVALDLLRGTTLVSLPRMHEVSFGTSTVLLSLVLAAAAAAGFGVMPMLRRGGSSAAVLQETGRGNTAQRRQLHVRHALMALQVGLAVMLLAAAGLLVRSFEHLRRVDPGFVAGEQLSFRLGLSETEYPDRESTAQFHERLLARLEETPGVRGAALTTTLPLDGDGWGDPYLVRGRAMDDGMINPIVRMRRVSAGFFEALSIPVLAGRGLERADETGTSNAVVVNRAFVEQYFGSEDPIGQQILPVGNDGADWLNIVGVVDNTATYSLREDAARAKVYMPLRSATTAGLPSLYAVSYVVATAGDPLASLPAIRTALAEIDANVAIARPEPVKQVVVRARERMAFTMLLLVTAATVAVLLGVIGVYAVIAYGVAQRTAEIGVRMALGARPRDVTSMIVRQNATIIGVGVAAGVVAAVACARLLGALLYGVTWRDLPTYAVVAAGLFAVALLAGWLPARRAARVNPTRAIQA